jgi:hypothetical protein
MAPLANRFQPKTVHLHWLFADGPVALRGVESAASLCGKFNLERVEVTSFLEDATCSRCMELAKEEADAKEKAGT